MSDQPSISDELAIINRVIEEHQKFRTHIKLIGDTITDREALSNLQRVRTDWVPGRLEALAEKQKTLEQGITALDEGLKRYFAFEEESLPPLLGELFMRALLIDHRQITREIDEAKKTAAEAKLEGLGRTELLTRESDIQQVISHMCQTIEDHATREEVILDMAQKALLEKQQDKN